MMSSLTILLLLLAVFTSHAFRVTSVTSSTGITASKSSIYAIQSIRGGDNDEYDEYDSDSEEEEEEVKSNLSASTKAALKKAQAKKNAEAKKTVSASLKSKPKKQKSGGIIKKIPYIVRCMLNPFTVFAMTKGYFASLFNIDYLQGVSVLSSFRKMVLSNHELIYYFSSYIM